MNVAWWGALACGRRSGFVGGKGIAALVDNTNHSTLAMVGVGAVVEDWVSGVDLDGKDAL